MADMTKRVVIGLTLTVDGDEEPSDDAVREAIVDVLSRGAREVNRISEVYEFSASVSTPKHERKRDQVVFTRGA
jgi:hypothetical protein